MIGQVAPDHLDLHWPAVAPLFERVRARRDGVMPVDEMRANVAAGRWQLWVALDGERITSALCTGLVREQDRTGAERKVLQFEILSGGGEEWRERAEAEFAEWGRREGCSVMRIAKGRMGWRRIFPDWRVYAVTLERPL